MQILFCYCARETCKRVQKQVPTRVHASSAPLTLDAIFLLKRILIIYKTIDCGITIDFFTNTLVHSSRTTRQSIKTSILLVYSRSMKKAMFGVNFSQNIFFCHFRFACRLLLTTHTNSHHFNGQFVIICKSHMDLQICLA